MSKATIPKHVLSKSTFLKGCQCPKALWLYKNQPELRAEISSQQQAIFSQGTSVGELAQRLFPGGKSAQPATPFEYQKSVAYTQQLIEQGEKIIYEACFQFEGVLCAIDILVKEKNKWIAFEAKSSTEVKDIYLLDCGLQYYIISNSGIKLDDISVIHINNQYVRGGELDLKQLFTIKSVKNEVLELRDFVKQKIDELKSVASAKKCPVVDIGPHCSDPYECDFINHCWNKIPDVSVFNLVRLSTKKKFELHKEGIVEFKDIPKTYPLSEGQQMQVESYLEKKSFIDKDAIKDFISELTYPIHYLDFETFQTAVPLFDGSRPYQQIPFQYSLHYKSDKNSGVLHSEFLAEANNDDPRITLIETLLEATSSPGKILTYNQSFEITRLREMANTFPKYKNEIEERISRVADLMLPFQQRWYYIPAMNGSYSIKSVLPALIPELSYKDLEIGDGGTASVAFTSLYQNPNPEEIKKIRSALLEYCKMDTYAMVRLLEHLENLFSN